MYLSSYPSLIIRCLWRTLLACSTTHFMLSVIVDLKRRSVRFLWLICSITILLTLKRKAENHKIQKIRLLSICTNLVFNAIKILRASYQSLPSISRTLPSSSLLLPHTELSPIRIPYTNIYYYRFLKNKKASIATKLPNNFTDNGIISFRKGNYNIFKLVSNWMWKYRWQKIILKIQTSTSISLRLLYKPDIHKSHKLIW